jgi:hypothetical protein
MRDSAEITGSPEGDDPVASYEVAPTFSRSPDGIESAGRVFGTVRISRSIPDLLTMGYPKHGKN